MNIKMGNKAKEVAMKRHDKQTIVGRVMEIYADMQSKQKNEA